MGSAKDAKCFIVEYTHEVELVNGRPFLATRDTVLVFTYCDWSREPRTYPEKCPNHRDEGYSRR